MKKNMKNILKDIAMEKYMKTTLVLLAVLWLGYVVQTIFP
jgi:hypothetical protein